MTVVATLMMPLCRLSPIRAGPLLTLRRCRAPTLLLRRTVHRVKTCADVCKICAQKRKSASACAANRPLKKTRYHALTARCAGDLRTASAVADEQKTRKERLRTVSETPQRGECAACAERSAAAAAAVADATVTPPLFSFTPPRRKHTICASARYCRRHATVLRAAAMLPMRNMPFCRFNVDAAPPLSLTYCHLFMPSDA